MTMAMEDLDRQELLAKSSSHVAAERQCRIELAANWKAGEPDIRRAIDLSWNPGGNNGRTSIIVLRPGKAVVQPLFRAQAWFGPFALILDMMSANNDDEKQYLREKYAAEKMRILNQYDYPRPLSHAREGYNPVGPHRFPDITCTVIDGDGNDLEPMRLHKIYAIGEFDKVYPLDSFGPRETVDEVRQRYEQEISTQAASFQKQMNEMKEKMAELAGLTRGLAVSVAGGKEK